MGALLSERQWGTVREDYSQDGNAWELFGRFSKAEALASSREQILGRIVEEQVRGAAEQGRGA